MDIADALAHARALTQRADDAAATAAYMEILRRDSTHLQALTELGTLALAGGFRSAARTAYTRAIEHHPHDAVARINLANVLREDNDAAGAALHYRAAIALDPELPQAHQGMAWVLENSDPAGAESHWRKGFAGHAMVTKPYRGVAVGMPVLLLVSARGGNVPTQLWITDRHFAVSVVYAEFYEAHVALPPHALIVNAIGDADRCGVALARAMDVLAHSDAPVINPPSRVRATGRAENARALACLPGVVAPTIDTLTPAAILAARELTFPLLLRRPGFHTGEHFVHVANRAALAPALAEVGGDELFVIAYLDARGPDGMSRKYRAMFIDGVVYPLHLAVSASWKVHYFSADMAHSAAFRDEERRFLEDMAGVLGPTAMAALERIAATLGLDYAGIDFGLAADGSIMVFEANASMVVFPPSPDPMWDYRRGAIDTVLGAATRMLRRRGQ